MGAVNKEAYMKGIVRLVKTFPDKDIDPEFMWGYLNDLDPGQYLKAIDMVIINSDTVNRATNLIAVIRKNAKPVGIGAQEAWGKVLDAARRRGVKGGHGFTDEAMVRTINAIGWDTICLTDNDRMGFVKRDFIAAYDVVFEHVGKYNDGLIIDQKAKALVERTTRMIGGGE